MSQIVMFPCCLPVGMPVSPGMSEQPEKSLPQRLKEALGDSYTIEGEIGRGGMGVVFRARDERLHRRVAIKVLPPELAFQKEIRERFTREAQTAARLSHPHIVPIHDVGEGQGLVYFVMGLVEGESLGARIRRRGKLPPEEARRIMRETADALATAHSLSVIHRDIKPDNILLEGTRGRVMVTDFGIAKALSATSGATLTGAGVAIGTPTYMSPEQAAGEREIDGRSDIYSLGIVSYQMLTGEVPFKAPTVAGILMKQITEVAPLVHDTHRDCPEDLSLAVSRCLEKDPENRWPTADALRRSLESRTVTGYRPTSPGIPTATSRRSGLARETGSRGRTLPGRERRVPARRADTGQRPAERPRGTGSLAGGKWVRNERGEWVRANRSEPEAALVRDTGEPAIVQRVRAQFARWAAVTGGFFMVNVATGVDSPWFLLVGGFMAIPLLKNYATLWQSGYSWRDVLNRPPAPDAIRAPGSAATVPLIAPKKAEFGAHHGAVHQAWADRKGILQILDALRPEEREQLPEVEQTTNALYERCLDLARMLHSLDSSLGETGIARIEQRIEGVRSLPAGEERDRQLAMLDKQKAAYAEANDKRARVLGSFESHLLAMQNMRVDLMRLKTQGISAAIGDLTQVTQQARALSRDIEFKLAAAKEIREAIG